ncbi:MAG: hypothetical protein K5686_07470 [Lachnospiraceae bacterium]|nr:hypothetical protein [Lachnospiraceae bacterium]
MTGQLKRQDTKFQPACKLLPFDMPDEVCQRTIENFFYYRVTPLTRQGLKESLEEYGIPAEYEAMIRAGSGRCIHDRYRLKCSQGS